MGSDSLTTAHAVSTRMPDVVDLRETTTRLAERPLFLREMKPDQIMHGLRISVVREGNLS